MTNKQKREIRKLIAGKVKPEEYASVGLWLSHCHNRPETSALIMEAANEILGGYGVEGIRDSQDDWLSYVNMGDTYDETLLYDSGLNEFKFGSWGDFVEQRPERFEEAS